MLKRLVVDPAASIVVLDGFAFLNRMGFLQRKMLMHMSKVTIPRESLCRLHSGWTAYNRTILHAISTDPLSSLCWLG